MTNRIAFQGALGAYSHEACALARPDMEPLPCATFEEVIDAVRDGRADLAMLPVENSTYGRVADIHRLLPESGLNIIDEVFVRVRVALMSLPGTKLADIKKVRAHLVLIPQAKTFLKSHGIAAEAAADSAGAAAELAQHRFPGEGVLASEIAARIHGLEVLAQNIEDNAHNTTRFLLMSPQADHLRRADRMMTTFIFEVKNVPAALYEAMGGFATNGVNMTKLESYQRGASFAATTFFADIEGHPEDPAVARALEELSFCSRTVRLLGTYKQARKRG